MARGRDADERMLLDYQARVFAQVHTKLIDVSKEFEDTVLFIIQQIIANRHSAIYCYMMAQLSELGTGFNSSFENGGAQSDRRDDVMLDFITCFYGTPLYIRLRGDQLTARKQLGFGTVTVTFPLLTWENRPLLVEQIARIMDWWETNGMPFDTTNIQCDFGVTRRA